MGIHPRVSSLLTISFSDSPLVSFSPDPSVFPQLWQRDLRPISTAFVVVPPRADPSASAVVPHVVAPLSSEMGEEEDDTSSSSSEDEDGVEEMDEEEDYDWPSSSSSEDEEEDDYY